MASMTAIPSSLSLRQGIWVKFSPPGLVEDLAGFARDLLQRLEAVGDEPGLKTAMDFTPSCASFSTRLVGVGLEPFLRPEARLEAGDQPLLGPAEAFAQQPRRLHAMAMIGVAAHEIAARDPVVGRDHDLRLEGQVARCFSIERASASI